MPIDHPTTAITIRPEENDSTQPIAGITKERSVLQAIMFKFSQASEVIKSRLELQDRAGVYFLWAEPWGGTGDVDPESQSEDGGVSTLRYLYVGSSQNLVNRLRTQAAKDWWQHGIVFSTANREIDGEQALYVEERLVKRAALLDKARLKNANWHGKSLPENDESTLLDANPGRKDTADYFFREILVTLPLLGLDALVSSEASESGSSVPSPQSQRFYLNLFGEEVTAEGEQRDDGFMVFKGARARNPATPGFTDQYAAAVYREKLIHQGLFASEADGLMLNQDKLFPSPSSAASVLAGSSCNGPKLWKNLAGDSLKELIEKGLSGNESG